MQTWHVAAVFALVCHIVMAQGAVVGICFSIVEAPSPCGPNNLCLCNSYCMSCNSAGLHSLEFLDNGTDFSWLTMLDLSHNNVKEMPPNIFDTGFDKLVNLALSGMGLTALPADLLSPLKQLSALDLSNNALSNLSATGIDTLVALRTLNLATNQLSALPDGVFNALILLQQLDISNNVIGELSDGIFDSLPQLNSLFLNNNALGVLPVGIFHRLLYLQDLRVSNNMIISLAPFQFQNLSSLSNLQFDNNLLSVIPGLASLQKLSTLNLANNKITRFLPYTFATSVQLTNLDLSGNGIQLLPYGCLQALSYLQILDLSNNNISIIPVNLFLFQSKLLKLNLSSSNIQTLDQNGLFGYLTSLVVLDLSHNNISRIESSIFSPCQSCSIQLLDLSFNSFTTVPNVSLLESTLQLVNLESNNLVNASQVQNDLQALFVTDKMDNYFPAQYDLANNAVSCGIRGAVDVSKLQVTLSASCSCSLQYTDTDGLCRVPTATQFPFLTIVFASLGSLGLGVIIVVIAFWIKFKFRRLRRNFADQRVELLKRKQQLEDSLRLLDEQSDELEQFKGGWNIEPDDLKLGPRIDGDSEGAFGEVWRAEWDGLQVAVKRLRSAVIAMDPLVLKNFETEVSFLRKCRHRNLVRFFGAGVMGGVPFLVTEFLAEGPLSRLLHHTPGAAALPWGRKLSLCLDIQAGMQYIHGLGQIHRDLKSDNVLLSGNLRAKVADFGSMRTIFRSARRNTMQSSRDTVANAGASLTTGVGTPMYMPPEMLEWMSPYSASVDVWSFGVLMWEIATQREPELSHYTPSSVKWGGPYMTALKVALRGGFRLPLDVPGPEQPWPKGFALMMVTCNALSPAQRPKFYDLGDELQYIADRLSAANDPVPP